MIRILIADDEKLIRAGLSKILNDSLDIPVLITEAKNGKEALELCKKNHPNILITDIKMPVMDGVELMTSLNSLPPYENRPQIIVLSGFDDFSYAKAAVKNGALTYILKPVDKKELIMAVNDAILNTQKELKERNEKFLNSIMQGGKVDYKYLGKDFYSFTSLYYVCVSGPDALTHANSVLDKTKFYLIEQKPTFAGLIFAWQGVVPHYDESILQDHSIGVSAPADNFSLLRTIRRQAQVASIKAFFNSDGTIAAKKIPGMYFYTESEQSFDFSESEKEYEKLVSSLDIHSSQEVQKLISSFLDFSPEDAVIAAPPDSVFESRRNYNAEKAFYIYTKVRSDFFTRFSEYIESDSYLLMKSLMIEDLTALHGLNDWISCVTDFLLYIEALLKRGTKESPYITEALAYINTYFTKNINMAMVANQVSVNYTWFSQKFKEHTGVNFNEYLKRLRIEEAKRLLQTGRYKVYEVAQRAGFGDAKYFMKNFREETGMSPSEWAKKHALRDQ